MILFNSVSRQIDVTEILSLICAPESLSKSFLKALCFSLSFKKKRCPWAFCTKKGKIQKNTSNCQSKESQMTVFAINHQCTVLWSLECLYLRDLMWCEPVPLNPQIQSFMTNNFRSAAYSIQLTLYPGHIQYMIMFTSSISP